MSYNISDSQQFVCMNSNGDLTIGIVLGGIKCHCELPLGCSFRYEAMWNSRLLEIDQKNYYLNADYNGIMVYKVWCYVTCCYCDTKKDMWL